MIEFGGRTTCGALLRLRVLRVSHEYNPIRCLEAPRGNPLQTLKGGTGMLARDILTHASNAHPDFYEALRRYVPRTKRFQRSADATTGCSCKATSLHNMTKNSLCVTKAFGSFGRVKGMFSAGSGTD